jgi:NAD(P)-dependent dehydrogenase (short-subunit alcohol dehydrogenase family)
MANYIVIAASSCIGTELVKQLEIIGHTVYRTSRKPTNLGYDFVLDATDFEEMDKAFLQAKEKMGRIDGVVNCAGSLLLKPAHLTSKQQYDDVLNASLTTSFAVARAAGKYMNEGGSVVLISSAAAREGLANHDAIAAAKAGIIGLALSCAATYASANIRFNAIAPGLVDTDLTKTIISNESSRKLSEGMHALGRIGKPDDIARAIVFLLDPVNSWITGQVLGVDGGLSSVRPKMKI